MITTRDLQALRLNLSVVLASVGRLPEPAPEIEIPSLYEFAREAWEVLEPGTPFVDGEHLRAICSHLEAVTDGRIKRLLINMPPRHMKSTIVSVIWPVWTWLKKPSHRFLCSSYALSLAIRDNAAARRLIESPWFQSKYGSIFSFAKDQNEKKKFQNNQGGYRQAVSVGSGATGEGADTLIVDDLHGIQEKTRDAKRQSAIDWFRNTWYSRLNDKITGAMVVVGQRIHLEDVSGFILSGETGDEWLHLNLATEYDPDSRCMTDAPGFHWEDWRVDDGQLLWPERFPQDVIDRAKKTHGALDYEAIYNQRPVTPGGHVFNVNHERLFTITPERDLYVLITPGGKQVVPVAACKELVTSDVAPKDKEINDFTVFARWAITPQSDVLLLDVKRGHWNVPKQKEQARLAYHTWYSERFQSLYFEDVGYQSAIGQDLLVEGIPCLPFYPKGDKVLRAGGASIWQEAGKVYFLQGAEWLEEWKKEIYTFPRARHDDQVDTLSMVCMLVREPPIEELDKNTSSAIQNFLYGG